MEVDIQSMVNGITQSAVTVGVVAVKLPTTPLVNRKDITIQNLGSNDIYIGNSAVTVGTGTKIFANGGTASLSYGPQLEVYGISAVAGNDVRILESK